MFGSILLLACLASTFASEFNGNNDIRLLDVSSVLVTGANRGIGLEFVRQLASLEPKISHIIATCRDPDAAKELKSIAEANNNVHIFKLDLTDYNSYDNLFTEVVRTVGSSGLDILINNAGILSVSPLDSVTPEELLTSFEVNAVAPYLLARKLTPLIKVSERKLIIAISTEAGSIETTNSNFGGFPAYKASKAALNMLTRTYADHVKKDGVNSVIIWPGWVKTDLGGPNAQLEKDFSVSSMIKTISTLNDANNGCFIDYAGKPVPW